MELEKKLADYRAKKAREEKVDSFKQMFSFLLSNLTILMNNKEKTDDEQESHNLLVNEDEVRSQASSVDEIDELSCLTRTDILYYSLCFALWTTCFIITVQLQFGMVFFIISALILMYFNTRTGPRNPNEVSAYSVFNKNCESINGALKAEQFENEIRYGAGTVR